MRENVIAIVPAAGQGKRFGHSVNKVFADISGIPLLIHTLKKLNNIKAINEIIPVLRQDDMEKGRRLITAHNLKKIKQIALGGKERQDSVNNALKLIKKDCVVMIHDGARPIISAELVKKLLKEVKRVDGVVPGTPVKETLKEVNKTKGIVRTVKREKFWTTQTPQVFRFKTLKKAYDRAYAHGFYSTDDAALVEKTGGKIKIITGDPFNIKVTTCEDLKMVEYLLNKMSK